MQMPIRTGQRCILVKVVGAADTAHSVRGSLISIRKPVANHSIVEAARDHLPENGPFARRGIECQHAGAAVAADPAARTGHNRCSGSSAGGIPHGRTETARIGPSGLFIPHWGQTYRRKAG